MELSEIDAEIARLEKLKPAARAREEKRRNQERLEKAVVLIPQLVAVVQQLADLGYLPKRLADVLTDTDGKVKPGKYLKRPRPDFKPHVGTSVGEQPTPGSPSAPRRKSPQSRATA